MSVFSVVIEPAEDADFDAGIGTGAYGLETYVPRARAAAMRIPNQLKADRAHSDAVEVFAIRDVEAHTTALQIGQTDAVNAVDPAIAALLQARPGVDPIQMQGKGHYA